MTNNHGLFSNALVLGGGGAKRVAYSGAIEALELSQFELVVGTSQGAVIAMLIALGVRKDHIQYFCEHDMAEVLSPVTIARYQDNQPIEALQNMAEDVTLTYCNHSNVLRELLQYEISSRIHQIYLFLFEADVLPVEHQWNNIEIKDEAAWASYQTDELSQQRLKNRLTLWIRQPQKLSFNDLAWLRQSMAEIGLDAHFKRLIMTAVKLTHSQAQGGLSGCYFGDGETTNIGLVDAVMASCAFVGIETMVILNQTTKGRYVDGGVLHQCPVFLAIKHLYKAEQAKILCLDLDAGHDSYSDPLILGLVEHSMIKVVNQALTTQLGMALEPMVLHQAWREQRQWLQSFPANKLIDINLKPVGIETFTMVVHPTVKKLAVQQAQTKVRTRLAALPYLLTPVHWLH